MVLSALPALVYIGLTVYSVIDCLQTPAPEVRRWSRRVWVAVIVLVPIGGSVSWLLAGRPERARHGRGPTDGPPRGWAAEGLAQYPAGPDDDPEFLAGLGRAQQERRRLLTRQEEARQEADRRRREEQQGGDQENKP